MAHPEEWTAHSVTGEDIARIRAREVAQTPTRRWHSPYSAQMPRRCWGGQTEGLQALASPSCLRVSLMGVPKVHTAPSWGPESHAPGPEAEL